MQQSFIEDIRWRGLLFQHTPGIEKALQERTTLYLGIDPTGDSLHVGHMLGILLMKRAYDYGHKVIIVAGGGTAMIGDPGGKDAERPILPKSVIEQNKIALKKQLSKFFDFDGEKAIMVDNADWLNGTELINFLRDVGKYISINSMLDKDSVRSRVEREDGMSYAEFSYQLLQAYDYLKLFEQHNCNVQIGGSDQWGNIVQGVELIRKKLQKTVNALSHPLIVNPKTGKKFGKTESGAAIWLDPQKTHPFALYQFFINLDDQIAPILLKYFSFESKQKVEEILLVWEKDPAGRSLQKALAYEMTSLIHDENAAANARAVSDILFDRGQSAWTQEQLAFAAAALPHATVPNHQVFSLENALVDLQLCNSKAEAKRLIQQNGASYEYYFEQYFLIRKGKKEYGIVIVN